MCERARWTRTGPSQVMQCKKIFCGKQRTMYFNLALGEYGSYHRDTSSYVENSILYKVLTNLTFWASKFGYKLGKVSTLKACKNETCYPYWLVPGLRATIRLIPVLHLSTARTIGSLLERGGNLGVS